MKKLTSLALAALTMLPATSFATSWSKEVTTAQEFKDQISAIGAGMEGETYEIICNWDPSTVVNVGVLKPTFTNGKIIIRSNQTDFDKMPQLQIAFQCETNTPQKEVKHRLSVIFENLNLIGTKSYLFDHRYDLYADTIALRRCNIHGQARSIIRFDGDKGTKEPAEMSVDYLEIKECMIHNTAQASSDNWSVFRTFMPLATFVIKDNIFYDMPYAKSLWETRNPNESPTNLYFTNNLVLLGENKSIATTGFTPLMAAANVAPGSQFYLYNNIFVGPKAGYTILHNDTCTYNNTKLTNVEGAVIMTNNNIIDEESYMSLTDLSTYLMTELATPSTLVPGGGDKTLADYPEFSWTTGTTFQDASKNMYYLLKSNPWYTQGYMDPMTQTGATYIGPSIAYVDAFPTAASVNIGIDGPSYITYTITPEKDVYYVDDEITVTVDPQNSFYINNLNTFDGWSDGYNELSRTIKLEGDIDLTAKFTDNRNIVSAFTLKGITSNGSPESYAADVYLDMDPSFQSIVYAIVNDTTEATGSKVAPFKYVNGTFQSRPAKFGEHDASMQMPILSNRTWAGAKEEQRNYALFVIPTKGIKDLHFSCYIGTDNNAAKTQALEFSTDSTTWTRLSTVDIMNLVWGHLEADLPAEANDKEKVYVRLIGDIKANGAVVTPDESIGMWDGENIVEEVYLSQDAFEYFGSIVITGDTSGAITGISEVSNDEQQLDENAPMYNIMGMKVAKGTKGLIIQNGKKFIVK